MKLSEAIERGCKFSKQSRTRFLDLKRGKLCACALGAAYIGLLSGKNNRKQILAGFKAWKMSVTNDILIDDVICNVIQQKWVVLKDRNLFDKIILMQTKKSRRQIALWLKKLGL